MNEIAPGPSVVLPQGAIVYDHNGERVEGWTREQLIKELTDLRVANNKAIGDPQRDVDLFIQKMKIPYSTPIPIITTHSVPSHTIILIERVNSWLGTRYDKLSQLSYVNPTEAARRSAICFACPMNEPWKDSCRSCRREAKDAIERNEIILGQNQRTKYHDRMLACSVAGHSNKVAPWLQAKFLAHRVNYLNKLPDTCWLKKLE